MPLGPTRECLLEGHPSSGEEFRLDGQLALVAREGDRWSRRVPAPNSGSTSGQNAKTKAKAKPKSKAESEAATAARALALGKAKREAGQMEEALTSFRAILRDYPNAPAASEAKELVDSMTGKPKMKK